MKKFLAAMMFVAFFTSAFADSSGNADYDTIKKNLKNNLPDLVVDQIRTTPFAGVYEVDSGRKVFYVDNTGNYAIIGNLLDLTTKDSMTEARTNELNRINWTKLPLDLAIKRTIGKGVSRIAVFTDPDCPFCKRLEAETIARLKDVTIYYYLFPLPNHPNAINDSKRILCAENPESALISFMAKDIVIGKSITCDKSKKVAQMVDIGTNLIQVNGTPTIVLPNGRIVSGLLPADYLSRLIDQNQPESDVTVVITKPKV